MPQDNTSTDDTASQLDPELQALVPEGSEIYDFLMGPIEEELLSKNIPLLAEKYKGEAEEQKQQRMERYRNAFTAYDKVYEEWIKNLRGAVKQKRSEAYRVAEAEEREEAESALSDLESQFETTTPSSK